MNNKNTVPMKPALLRIEQLRPFEGHPYKVQDNEEMAALSESIRENGVLSPLIVRSVENSDEYEVISGHRRLYAARKAGLTEVPVLIYTLDRDAAAIALVDSNLHREHILPSEKAYAYKLKMEALSHQGIACGQVGHKSRDDISDTDSGRQVQRYHVNTINKNICFFSCSNYVKDYRGSCPTRHYVRADAIEQVVKLELQRMAQFLRDDEPMFADLLERKSNWEIAEEKKHLEGELQKARMRTETVSRLYKKAFEKNAEGLLSDEGFLQITHEYDVEQLALKAKIPQLREQIAEAERQAANKDKFIAAIRKFMQMDELTAPLLRELIDHIEVYETQGVGKSRTQRITIHYRFVGYIDIPAAPLTSHYISETRQGVAVEYIPA